MSNPSNKRPVEKETRVAKSIYLTPRGRRLYLSRDGVLRTMRFKPDVTLEQLQDFVNEFNRETAKLRKERREAEAAHKGTFAADADRYLELKTIQAMPSYEDRVREISRWKHVFGTRARQDITPSLIR